jgi:hypothetical protein
MPQVYGTGQPCLTFFVPRLLRSVLVSAFVLALTSCSGGSGPAPRPAPSTDANAIKLTQLATGAAQARYTATYAFHLQDPDTNASVKVWHAPGKLRVDVTAGKTTATLIVTSAATYSCSVKAAKKTCFKVAGRGQPAPAPFNVGPATLFTADLDNLAAHGRTYTVLAAGPGVAASSVPASTCLAVAPALLSPQPQVKQGIYCFADAGLLTSVTYTTGNSARLTTVDLGPPTPRVFTPYVRPAPLPS